MIGRTLSHYDIIEKIGAGGMDEVYAARDTKLGRDVAIKLLPSELATDPERIARSRRRTSAGSFIGT
jgi:serine/threonine protein kinase